MTWKKAKKVFKTRRMNMNKNKANAKTDLVMERIIKFMSNKAYLASEYESMMKTGETAESLFGKRIMIKRKAMRPVEKAGYEGG